MYGEQWDVWHCNISITWKVLLIIHTYIHTATSLHFELFSLTKVPRYCRTITPAASLERHYKKERIRYLYYS